MSDAEHLDDCGEPMATLRLSEGSLELFPKFWRKVRDRDHLPDEAGVIWFLDPAINALLEDPSHPDAVVPVYQAETFMDAACCVPGWDRLDGDPRPIDFIPPGEDEDE